MNNDIVVKQNPGSQPTTPDLAVRQSPQSAEPSSQSADKVIPEEPVVAAAPVSKKSSAPVGIIMAAIFVALCLVTVAIYIGYNQSQAI
jgi:uncharacterized protein HemX